MYRICADSLAVASIRLTVAFPLFYTPEKIQTRLASFADQEQRPV